MKRICEHNTFQYHRGIPSMLNICLYFWKKRCFNQIRRKNQHHFLKLWTPTSNRDICLNPKRIKFSSKLKAKKHLSLESLRKTSQFPLYWLFNRDPYFMVHEIIPTYLITGLLFIPKKSPKQREALFSGRSDQNRSTQIPRVPCENFARKTRWHVDFPLLKEMSQLDVWDYLKKWTSRSSPFLRFTLLMSASFLTSKRMLVMCSLEVKDFWKF